MRLSHERDVIRNRVTKLWPAALPVGFLEDRSESSGRNVDPAVMMAAKPNLLDQLQGP